jgi:hypothetical protein
VSLTVNLLKKIGEKQDESSILKSAQHFRSNEDIKSN